MKRRKILVADLLCGAGGSSTGCAQALASLGLEMELVCVNHWGVAIETHKKNHPEARHYVQDIATVRPHLLVPEGYLDLLMASPTCTHHSIARGGKPTSDQQRSDPWHIITWLTELRVKRIIIENVWEFRDWGPVNARTGKPIKSRKGEYFHAWISALKALGFEVEYRKLNAADFGDATTRQRFILMGRSDGKPIRWPMPSHTKPQTGKNVSLFDDMKPWKPASAIIDWSIEGRSIFNRKKPLAPKTLARIHAGAVKHDWPEPFLVILRRHMTSQGIDVPLPTITANGTHIGLAEPFVMATGSTGAPRATDEPLPQMMDEINGKAEPFVISPRHGKENAGPRPRSVDEPLPTITAGGSQVAVVEPFILSQGAGGVARNVSEPVPTIPTGGAHALISPYYGSGSGENCNSTEEPLPTMTTQARFGLVVPITHSDGSNRARGLDEPLPTLTTANRGELAFIAAAFGEREGQAPRTHDISEPVPTICATGRVNLVEAAPEFDIRFRMLEPHELAAAMGLDGYEFAGNKTQQIKQIGNAVSVAKMKACVTAIMSDVAATDRELIVQRAAE